MADHNRDDPFPDRQTWCSHIVKDLMDLIDDVMTQGSSSQLTISDTTKVTVFMVQLILFELGQRLQGSWFMPTYCASNDCAGPSIALL